jgi:hypothetical protein
MIGRRAGADAVDSTLALGEHRTMADAAVLSVIFSGAAGLTGLALAAHGQHRVAETEHLKLSAAHREEQRKRLETRREDLLGILDEAAKTAMSIRVASSAEELGNQRAAVQEVRNVVLGAHEQLARLGVRVGPDHELYACYQDVAGALDDWRAARAQLRGAKAGAADEQLASAEMIAADACRVALERFLSAATTEIGHWGSETPATRVDAGERVR